MTQTQARAIYVYCTEPRHRGCGAQSRQVRELGRPVDAAPPATASARPPPGGSPLGLQGGSAQGLGSSPRLLTRSHSHQTPLHLLPFLLRQGRPQVWKGREELTISPAEERGSGWGRGAAFGTPQSPSFRRWDGAFLLRQRPPNPEPLPWPSCLQSPHLKMSVIQARTPGIT